ARSTQRGRRCSSSSRTRTWRCSWPIGPTCSRSAHSWPRATRRTWPRATRSARPISARGDGMTLVQAAAPTPRKPLRLWPGVVAVVLQWLVMLGLPIVAPETGGFGILGGIAGGLVVLVWWMFFSRALWSERAGAVVLIVVALIVTSRLVHESIATGMM